MSHLLHDSIEDNMAAQLRQNFDSTFTMPPASASASMVDMLTIRLAGDPYAIRLLEITEIVMGREIVSVPSVTPDLLGLTSIRGGIVPVFSMSSILGYSADPESPRWMVLCGSEEPIALAFSDFEGHLRLSASDLHSDEKLNTTSEKNKYVNQAASVPDGVRAVISIAHIMGTIRNRISRHRPTKE